ncbi:ribosome small subunit-dependent GTPase A [Geobacter sp. SVR]|uniref:ribosome small subunit-dependent GTPase A n=1 Tax=Geobacter sp. SVR TaxID=2495594 RepID=UPI00143EF896|nr:ribosome small subunit-dependent GTPase A [Geobacter sp. SVR]BCS54371.1 putative ribosome biogenesis GTPase RsgA [Geobacter sp. SVR]GCF87460.1 putative ribosome biogenesis GTPase RsgA [Geobacter sp. SVR]
MKDKPFRSGSTRPTSGVSGNGTECEGLIVAHHGVAVEVRLADGSRRMVRIKRNSGHVVGDRVTVTGETLQRLPRSTELRRGDARGGVHLVAANLDVLGIVAAQLTPAGFIDRAIVAARAAGLAPFLVINKCDLEEMSQVSAALYSLYTGSLPIFPLSALTRTGLAPLQEFLSSGHRGAFVGTTGVGKSALLNALCPDIDLKVGSASEYKHMGRHTTTVATLHALAGGGELVDTPGFRDFGLVDITVDDLAAYYAGFEEHEGFACRFRNCRHRSEPGCAVAALLEQGRIPAERYATYLDLLSEVEAGEEESRSRNWRN